MPVRFKNFLAAVGYLLALPLAFLPGLMLWLWARDREPWLERHSRSAALVNGGVVVGYAALAPFTHIVDLLATLVRLYEISNLKFEISDSATPPGILYALWGPHYLAALFTSLASLGFVLLWLSAILFNLISAWRAMRGLGPWVGESGGRKDEGRESKTEKVKRSKAIEFTSAGKTLLEASARRDLDTRNQKLQTRNPPPTLPNQLEESPPRQLETKNQKAETRYRKLCLPSAAFTIYLAAAALLLLAPLHFDLRHYLIAYHHPVPSDASIYLWSLAWWPWAIRHHLDPFFSPMLWSPVGVNLLWMTSIGSLALLLAPLTHWFGVLVSYNVMALLSPALAAWAAYLLCRYITGKFGPALFGGWLFGFSSYAFANLQITPHLSVTFALPLAVWLYLLRRDGKLSRRWYVGLIALLALFQFGVSTELLASAVPLGLLAIWLAAVFSRDELTYRRHRQGLWETLIGLAVAGAVLSPAFYSLFVVHYASGPFLPAAFSTDLANFVIPTPITWLGSSLNTSLHFMGTVWFRGAYLGLPLLGILAWFSREFIGQSRARLLLLMLVIIFLLALGSQLQIAPFVNVVLPVLLPWALVAHLPIFDKIVPLRLVVYLWLALAVVGAWWLADSRTHWGWKLLLAGSAILFLFPNVSSGRWVQKTPNPPYFAAGITPAYLPAGCRVVILPYGRYGYSMLWQAEAHFHFLLAGGYVNSGIPRRFTVFPAVAAFYAGRATDPRYPAQLRQFIKAFKIRAFIVAAAHPRRFRSLVAPLHIKPIHVGGVWLYLLPPMRRAGLGPIQRY